LSASPAAPSDVLVTYGHNDRVRPFATDGLELGRVARVDRASVTVVTASGPVRAAPGDQALTTGDWVGLRRSPVPAIVEVAPRWSLLERRTADRTSAAQPLAANVDLVLLTVGLDRGPNLRRLDRLLTLAWASGATPVVVLTKADVAPDVGGTEAIVAAGAMGVEVLATSVQDGRGLERLRALVGPGTTAVLLGESGAGKSSLVNALAAVEVEIGAVRGLDHKGRHTTRTRELIPLVEGGVLLDTPGIRGVGLAGRETEGLERTFAEIADLAQGCRYRDCGHRTEPGCAVRIAIEEGTLAPQRLSAYEQLTAEVTSAARRADRRTHRADTRLEGRARKRFLDEQRRWRGES
jgi:ribosome biogenesis GTPase / thiamine phosphate phosphatase